MARGPERGSDLTSLTSEFIAGVVRIVEQATRERIQAAVAGILSGPVPRRRGRPPKSATVAAAAPAPPRRKARVTAKSKRARRLQGKYLGALRALSADARTQVKKAAKEKGVPEALKLARSLRK